MTLVWYGRDKGIPIGWSFNWEKMARWKTETCGVESLHVLLCALSVSGLSLAYPEGLITM
jgi:hypothetical protein